ncbi:MAG: hypothetical protein R3D68_20640 [Hyphomicrobiaceae bacterium]
MNAPTRSPDEALSLIFEVIRQEAATNPTFARRLLDAAGVPVRFTGPDAVAAADPVIAAARNEYPAFREMFLTFSEAELKKLLKGHALATDEQVKKVTTKPKKDGFIDLLWDGARRRLIDRRVG